MDWVSHRMAGDTVSQYFTEKIIGINDSFFLCQRMVSENIYNFLHIAFSINAGAIY